MTDLRALAAQVVDRARSWDQNAMAMIVELRKRALGPNPNPRATASFRFVTEYLQQHPVSKEVSSPVFGIDAKGISPLARISPNDVDALTDLSRRMIDCEGGLFVFGVWASHGPAITDMHLLDVVGGIQAVGEAGGTDEATIFRTVKGFMTGWGIADGKRFPSDLQAKTPEYIGAFLGQGLRQAWVLQRVRRGDVPLKLLCPVVAWEHGEEG